MCHQCRFWSTSWLKFRCIWTIKRHCIIILEHDRSLKVGIRGCLPSRHPSRISVYRRDRSCKTEALRKCQLGHLRFMFFMELSLFTAYIQYGGMRGLLRAEKPLRDDYVAQLLGNGVSGKIFCIPFIFKKSRKFSSSMKTSATTNTRS